MQRPGRGDDSVTRGNGNNNNNRLTSRSFEQHQQMQSRCLTVLIRRLDDILNKDRALS